MLFINSLVTILNLLLQRHFRVDPDDKEHVDRVLEATAKKVVRDTISNARLQATNAYVKSKGAVVNDFRQYSTTFLTVERYAEVNDS